MLTGSAVVVCDSQQTSVCLQDLLLHMIVKKQLYADISRCCNVKVNKQVYVYRNCCCAYLKDLLLYVKVNKQVYAYKDCCYM